MDDVNSERKTMRFLSFAGDGKEDAEKEAKLKEAAAKIEQAMAKQKELNELVDYKEEQSSSNQQIDLVHDTRSLYERLQEQKDKKKESLDESQRLSNMITKLDDDDVEYLNEVAKKKREDELRRRLEIKDALDAKKRLDEQKILEDHRRLKESLLGKSHQDTKTSTTKSRISSLIKMKSRIKSRDFDALNQRNKPSKPDLAPAKDAASNRIQESSDGRFTEPIRDEAHQVDQHATKESRNLPCSCPKNVMKAIGVLPSLPIVRDARDFSEKDSDCSDDDLHRGLVPRSSKKRK